ncbi:MAG: preprotein translocase subunit YajC [Prevotella sp.]|nr:preprotein translocase subunit YajC [Prevotella sp.]MBP3828487.1 preprotein translocase subunit YajC [Prevotella sp.]MBQ3827151.1 preprotein translocase subunit YajC [Prevotella sp.]MBQ4147806.1 preprotein translocase subunit YajC [Prevotella sp.]MBQ4446393.1 preprotein translocase subunit YajC [Prevotella sp.]
MTTVFLAAQAAQGQGGGMSFLIMMVALFAIMWFFMIRPQQKKQKEIRAFQNALQEGSKVVTGGGIYGTVKRIDAATNTIEVEIARGVVIRVDRGYVFADASSSVQAQAK